MLPRISNFGQDIFCMREVLSKTLKELFAFAVIGVHLQTSNHKGKLTLN